ncbi:MAG: zeta toxin family protein [Prevotellaceae bacterium]|jgi:predicted ABC-type ATPase|nr:zeta toxin family protein [Prevotellaceae bacterium]
MQTTPEFLIIAGANGAGKTTAAYTLLPDILACKEYVNADEIARGLSPFQVETVAIEAGKIMLQRITELLNTHKSLAIETTLASKIYQKYISMAKRQGYHVSLIFFWLQDLSLAKERVRTRVLSGGHHIDNSIIERRYYNGILNLFDIYLSLVDNVLLYDNSQGEPSLIAEISMKTDITIIDKDKYNLLIAQYENRKRTC